MEPITILTAFIPIITDVIKSAIGKFTGNAPPIASAEDYAKINDADIKKLEVLYKLDEGQGTVSTWVNNLKVLQRVVVVYITIVTWMLATFVVTLPDDRYKLVSELTTSIFFFLFGDRVNFYLGKGKGRYPTN